MAVAAVRVCSLLVLLSGQLCAARHLHLAVIAPENGSHPYSLRRILPPIQLAVRRLAEMGDNSPLPGWHIELHVRDTNCSSAVGPIEAFKLFYLNKTAVISSRATRLWSAMTDGSGLSGVREAGTGSEVVGEEVRA
ncbi:hypothetical protein FJT64_008772 [Amphibalanus amphitrite]|uniref:Receptor ligand binding region domain-containing protein n=1 Tax=Amphibalanus amphitrite TaxID=1232801 RepID=A0A6A4VVF5_AMPAM|nr:hypothetical protein FJT64_008772 [Amphibalanus amphitrite]